MLSTLSEHVQSAMMGTLELDAFRFALRVQLGSAAQPVHASVIQGITAPCAISSAQAERRTLAVATVHVSPMAHARVAIHSKRGFTSAPHVPNAIHSICRVTAA